MAESREYYTQSAENGSVQISDEVVASIAAMAALEVEGVCGLSGSLGIDLAEMLGKKTLSKGVRLTGDKNESVCIECNVIAKFGVPVFELAKSVQQTVRASVESVTGLSVDKVNVNICGVSLPKESKK